jgi:hypothetical protein
MSQLGQLFGVHHNEDAKEVGYTADEFRSLSAKEQLEIMQTWFHERFEDPVHELPYNSREGGYQYINGGPVDANEELQDEFGTVVDLNLIEEAVKELEVDGIYDWSPRRNGEDYYDEEDLVLPDGVVDADAKWPPIVVTPVSLNDARKSVEKRLSELETAIAPFLTGVPGIGHNNPPSEIDADSPLKKADAAQINIAIYNIKIELPKDDPDEVKIAEQVGIFSKAANALRKWIGARLTNAADVVVGGIAALTITNARTLLEALGGAVESISKWIELLPW